MLVKLSEKFYREVIEVIFIEKLSVNNSSSTSYIIAKCLLIYLDHIASFHTNYGIIL